MICKIKIFHSQIRSGRFALAVIAIANTSGTIVVGYTYDAWGNVTSITGTLASTIGQLNPMRYRSYYYDAETGYYYLQSRYYESAMGRFVNSDDPSVVALGKSYDNNMFAYCDNNPINLSDANGAIAQLLLMAIGAILGALTLYALDVVVNICKNVKNIFQRRSSYADYALAALGGALGAIGIGKLTNVLCNCILTTAQFASKGGALEYCTLIGLTLAFSLVGSGGKCLKEDLNIIDYANGKLLAAQSAKKINQYKALIHNCKISILINSIISIIKSIAGYFKTFIANSIYKGVRAFIG